MTNIGGSKQKEFERIAQTLIQYVTKVHKVRLSKIVLDFVQDETRTFYLVGVPALEIDNTARIFATDTPAITYDEFKPKLTASEVLEDKSALVF